MPHGLVVMWLAIGSEFPSSNPGNSGNYYFFFFWILLLKSSLDRFARLRYNKGHLKVVCFITGNGSFKILELVGFLFCLMHPVHQDKWNEMKWNKTKQNEMKWNEMRWNKMKWNEMTKYNMKKKLTLVSLELVINGLQVRRANHYTTRNINVLE